MAHANDYWTLECQRLKNMRMNMQIFGAVSRLGLELVFIYHFLPSGQLEILFPENFSHDIIWGREKHYPHTGLVTFLQMEGVCALALMAFEPQPYNFYKSVQDI